MAWRKLLLGGVLALLICAHPARAVINSFATRTAFNSAVGAIDKTENFSSFATDDIFRTATVTANGFTLHQEGVDQAFRNLVDAVPLQNAADSNGTANASCYTNLAQAGTGATNIRIAFPSLARGWGADFYNVEDAGAGEGLTMDVIVGGATAATFAVPNHAAASGFFGVAATAGEQIQSVLLRSTTLIAGASGEGFGIDDAAMRSVPEPGMMIPICAGGLAVARRLRLRGSKRT